MARAKSEKVNLTSPPTTEKDLATIRALNIAGKGGINASFPKYNEVAKFYTKHSGGEVKLDAFTYQIIGLIKNWQQQKFIYSDMETIDTYSLERDLLWLGKSAVFKIAGKLYCAPFVQVGALDIYGRPKKIRPVFPNNTRVRVYTVDVDCVIFYNDGGTYFTNTTYFGTLFRVWELIESLRDAWENINRNLITSKQFFKVPSDISSDNVLELERIFRSSSIMIPLTNNLATSLKNTKDNDEYKLDHADKTKSVWENFHNCYDELKKALGIPSNANAKKAERQITAEINTNNAISVSQIKAMYNSRKKALDKVNEVFKMKSTLMLGRDDDLALPYEKTNPENQTQQPTRENDEASTSNKKAN